MFGRKIKRPKSEEMETGERGRKQYPYGDVGDVGRTDLLVLLDS